MPPDLFGGMSFRHATLMVAGFMPHDSRLKFWTSNHVQDAVINDKPASEVIRKPDMARISQNQRD